MADPVKVSEDRSLSVPPGKIVRTGYASVWDIKLANRSRMSVGDFKTAYEKRLNCGDNAPFPCPNGYWEGEEFTSKFIIMDGRHEWLATVALGYKYILVAWLVDLHT
jgi:hypothetical protein